MGSRLRYGWWPMLLGMFGVVPAVAGVRFEVRAPAGTPPDAVLWISGDVAELGHWNGAGLRLTTSPEGRYVGTVELPPGTAFAFKVRVDLFLDHLVRDRDLKFAN